MGDSAGPSRDRPEMPEGYGVPDSSEGLLDWSDVDARLVAAPQYWMATTRPDGRPHVVPRWGVWVDGRLWYDGAPTTVHARNLARAPACTLHLEDGLGRRSSSTDRRNLPHRRASTSAPDWRRRSPTSTPIAAISPNRTPGRDRPPGLVMFTPASALAGFDFPNDVTRFRFGV